MLPSQQDLTNHRESDASGGAILAHLTLRQHVRPHQPIIELLNETKPLLGCCPSAIRRGIAWLGIDPSRPAGRLRRCELVQLARAIHRFWMQEASAKTH